MENKQNGDCSREEVTDDVKQQILTNTEAAVEQPEDQQHNLSPNKSQESSAFVKPRSPLGFLKNRLGSKKRRESGGQSEVF